MIIIAFYSMLVIGHHYVTYYLALIIWQLCNKLLFFFQRLDICWFISSKHVFTGTDPNDITLVELIAQKFAMNINIVKIGEIKKAIKVNKENIFCNPNI